MPQLKPTGHKKVIHTVDGLARFEIRASHRLQPGANLPMTGQIFCAPGHTDRL